MWRHSAAALLVAAAPPVATAGCPTFQAPIVAGNVANASLDEISGAAWSRRQPGILWVHNDGANGRFLHAITTTGESRARYELNNAPVVDAEDIAIGRGPVAGQWYLYLADTGDNDANRNDIAIYRVVEPPVSLTGPVPDGKLNAWDRFPLRLDGGVPRDIEAMAMDPLTGTIVLMTRDRANEGFARVYELARPTVGTTAQLTEVGRLRHGTVGSIKALCIAPDGSWMAALRHASNTQATAILLLERSPEDSPTLFRVNPCRTVNLPPSPQPEALAIAPDARSVAILGEAANPPITLLQRPPGDPNGWLVD